jgi:hypothetical protein
MQPHSLPLLPPTMALAASRVQHELLYRSLFVDGHGYVFPCDAQGCVDIAGLSARVRESYARVCELVGRQFAMPELRPVTDVRRAEHRFA